MSSAMSDPPGEEEMVKWAKIFQTIGREQAREILYYVVSEFEVEDSDRCVVEFGTSDEGAYAMPITEFVEELEETVDLSQIGADKEVPVDLG